MVARAGSTPSVGGIAALGDLVSWTTVSLGESPFSGYWIFNPSVIVTPDGKWLCSVRCSNYHMPGSTFSQRTTPAARIHNRNLMLELDPSSWRVLNIVEIQDLSGEATRGMWTGVGFEDLRLVWTDDDGLCAIGSAMRPDAQSGGVVEICALTLDGDYKIIAAAPLRGSWSNQHQKNWSPFQNAKSLRMLFSPLEGGVHTRSARVISTHDPMAMNDDGSPTAAPGIVQPPETKPISTQNGHIEVQISKRFISPHQAPKVRPAPVRLALRGSTQLSNIGTDDAPRWVGLAHSCRVGNGFKMYWHQLYEVDDAGDMVGLSRPFKLNPDVGIEFAAGLVLDPKTNRAIISFGIEDDSAWIGEAPMDALLALLDPIGSPRAIEPAPHRASSASQPPAGWTNAVTAPSAEALQACKMAVSVMSDPTLRAMQQMIADEQRRRQATK